MRDALIVFAKIPSPNKVKTRLTTLLTPEDSANLYEAFLLDALDLYVQLPADVRLYLSPPAVELPAYFQREDISIHWQSGDGLGPRMAHAFAETFLKNYERIVIIGTDHPTLPMAYIEEAFGLLEESLSISIGPSDDGGYYLLGMNEFYPQLFRDMEYSHSRVFQDTLDRASETGAQLNVLPLWYDVDTPDTLVRLARDLKEADALLVRTRSFIQYLGEHYKVLHV